MWWDLRSLKQRAAARFSGNMLEPVPPALRVSPLPSPVSRCPGETIESKAGGLQLIQAIASLGPQVQLGLGKTLDGGYFSQVFLEDDLGSWELAQLFGKK